jgi:hypothetical protein
LSDQPFQGTQLENTARVLTEQVAKAWAVPGFAQNDLPSLSQLNEAFVTRLLDSHRFEEAREVIKDRIEFLRECGARDPKGEGYRWHIIEACLLASKVENDDSHPVEAIAFLDRSTALVLNADGDNSRRLLNACRLASDYRQLQDQLTTKKNRGQANHARDGRISLLRLIADDNPRRPDLVLLKACLLADDGDWDRARGVVEPVFESQSSVEDEPKHVREAIQALLPEWLVREIQHWDQPEGVDKVACLTLDQQTDRILRLISHLTRTSAYTTVLFPNVLVRELNKIAMGHRKAGRLDRAERVVALHTGVARELVRKFPACASWHWFLAEAYVQQSKNAWRRENMPAIKRGLEQSIETLHVAMRLDPKDARIRRNLLDQTERLGKLPRS